ncbi:MAG: hypothetical protein IJQ10_01345 [Clostridia bacterium]|nr:hypothetical protein [Clostridia bacterium]
MNSRKLKSAVALALMAALVGNQATLAMNGSKSVSNSFSSKTGCLSEKSAKQENMLKKLWPLWSALGVGAVGLIAWGLYKAFKPGDKDSPDEAKGAVYCGLGKFKSADELKENWKKIFGDFDESKLLRDFLINLRDKHVKNLKKEDRKEFVTDLIKSSAKIYFNDGNFDCYDAFDKKLNLTDYERDIILSIAKLFREKLGIVPCEVSRCPRCFYFSFKTNEGAETEILNTHASGIGNLLCDFKLFN